jgi:hypothetical protein
VLQASQEAKKDLQVQLYDELAEGRAAKDIVADAREFALRSGIPEHDVIALVRQNI